MEETKELTAEEINANLAAVRQRIENACKRAGRDPEDVTLIAVSKLKPVGDVEAAFSAGVRDFGENYVQELKEKISFFSERPAYGPIRWHMIGHLQKNKVKYLIGKTALIHSVDTVSLAEQIEKEAAKQDTAAEVLLEVNVAREESKWGFSPEETPDAAREISALPHVRLLGLMTSAPYTEDSESNRRYFRELKALAESLKEAGLIAESSRVKTPVLSMGMSGDFETAVEEGATMVRVGTSIFGARNYTKR